MVFPLPIVMYIQENLLLQLDLDVSRSRLTVEYDMHDCV